MKNTANSRRKGFTLIELLIVIGIIGFLAAAVLVAVDPVRRIQDSRDSQRWSEVNAILNGILKHQVDNRALFNGSTTAPILASTADKVQVIVSDETGITCTAPATRPGCDAYIAADYDNTGALTCVANLEGTTAAERIVPEYLAEIPTSPKTTSDCGVGSGCAQEGGIVAIGTTNSGYYIRRSAGNRIEIGSCDPEQSASISVKR